MLQPHPGTPPPNLQQEASFLDGHVCQYLSVKQWHFSSFVFSGCSPARICTIWLSQTYLPSIRSSFMINHFQKQNIVALHRGVSHNEDVLIFEHFRPIDFKDLKSERPHCETFSSTNNVAFYERQPPPQFEHCPAPFLGLTVQPSSELWDSAAGFDVFPVKVIEIEKKPHSSQCRTLCQSLVACLHHLGGSDLKSAERQQNRNYIKKNLNSKNIANFFGRILKVCRKNHSARFHAEPCRDKKHVQKNKRNMRPTELNWGVAIASPLFL